MTSTASRLFGLLLVLAATFFASTSVAKDPATVSVADKASARAAMDRGDAHFDKGEHAQALKEYLQADQLMGVPSTGVLVGKAYEALAKLVEANDAYLAVGRYKHTPGKRMPDAFLKAQQHAAARAAEIGPKIPTLQIVITGLADGATPEVKIDGNAINVAALTRSVNPGDHTVTVGATGYVEQSQSATLAESEKKTLTFKLDEDPNAAAAPTPTPTPTVTPSPAPVADTGPRDEGTIVPAAIAFAIGGAGIVAGAITGGLTFAKEGDLAEACPSKVGCDADSISEANTLANISNITFAVGGVGVALGVVFIFVFAGDDEPEETAITPILSPDMVGLAGRF